MKQKWSEYFNIKMPMWGFFFGKAPKIEESYKRQHQDFRRTETVVLIKLVVPLSWLKSLVLLFYEPRIMKKLIKAGKTSGVPFQMNEELSFSGKKQSWIFFQYRIINVPSFQSTKFRTLSLYQLLNYWKLLQNNCQDMGLNYY